MLTDTEVHALRKRNGQPVILPNIGIVALAADKWETFSAWQKNVEDTQGVEAAQQGALSPYLIFSLFNDARMKLTLAGRSRVGGKVCWPRHRRRPRCRSCCGPTSGAG